MSPLGIVLAGAGAGCRHRHRTSHPAAAGVGVLAWGTRVLASVPRGARRRRVGPSRLSEPWFSHARGRRRGKKALRSRGLHGARQGTPRAAATAVRPTRRGDRRVVAHRPPWPRAAGCDRHHRHDLGPARAGPAAGLDRRPPARRRPRQRRSRRWRHSWGRCGGSSPCPTAAATGCGCSTPASTSSSPARSRSVSGPATRTLGHDVDGLVSELESPCGEGLGPAQNCGERAKRGHQTPAPGGMGFEGLQPLSR